MELLIFRLATRIDAYILPIRPIKKGGIDVAHVLKYLYAELKESEHQLYSAHGKESGFFSHFDFKLSFKI